MVPGPEFAETAQCLCFAARRAARAITRAFDRDLRPHGLRATQFSLLAVLELKGPQRIGDLARTLGADRTTLTRNLEVAAGEGLVRIGPDADPRARVAAIAPKGRATLAAAFPAWRRSQRALTERIGTQAADGLRRLARAARA
jgi:DNA-binding MarR family transcriptional regulator